MFEKIISTFFYKKPAKNARNILTVLAADRNARSVRALEKTKKTSLSDYFVTSKGLINAGDDFSSFLRSRRESVKSVGFYR